MVVDVDETGTGGFGRRLCGRHDWDLLDGEDDGGQRERELGRDFAGGSVCSAWSATGEITGEGDVFEQQDHFGKRRGQIGFTAESQTVKNRIPEVVLQHWYSSVQTHSRFLLCNTSDRPLFPPERSTLCRIPRNERARHFFGSGYSERSNNVSRVFWFVEFALGVLANEHFVVLRTHVIRALSSKDTLHL